MPAISSKNKAKALFFATMLAPVLLVQLVRAGLGSSPASAVAATDAGAAASSAPAVPAKPLSQAQQKALSWIAAQPNTSPLRSPMDRPDPQPVIVHEPTPPPVEPLLAPIVTQPFVMPTFNITGIIGVVSSDGIEQALASINHRVYRVGDEVVKGWIVFDIDSRNRTVTLHGPDGRVITLSPPQPDLDRP